jgi:hypothetical protein
MLMNNSTLRVIAQGLLGATVVILSMFTTMFAQEMNGQGIKVGQYSHAVSMTDPEATFQGARVVYNVTVDGQKGMRIHAQFRVRYGQNVPCQMIAYFFDEDGTPLEASDDNYTTKQGKVSASARFTPRYDPAVYNDLQIFIPYEALNLESGDKYNLKFYLALYDQDGKRFFGKSGWYKFYVTMP